MHMLGQRRRFEAFDFAYHVLRAAEVERLSKDGEQHATRTRTHTHEKRRFCLCGPVVVNMMTSAVVVENVRFFWWY